MLVTISLSISSLVITEIEPATSSMDCSTRPPTTTTVPSSWPSSSLLSSSSLPVCAITRDEDNANSIETTPVITLIFVISHLLRSIMTFPHCLRLVRCIHIRFPYALWQWPADTQARAHHS